MSRTVDCLVKKGLSILDSNIWWLDVPKDVTYISFEDYCDYLSNRICKILIQYYFFIKKQSNKKKAA